MDINFNTPESIFQINQIPLHPTVTKQLITCQVSVMRGVTVVMIQGFVSISFLILVIIIEQIVAWPKNVMTEVVKGQ